MLKYTKPIAFPSYIARYDTYPGQFRGTIGEEMQRKHSSMKEQEGFLPETVDPQSNALITWPQVTAAI